MQILVSFFVFMIALRTNHAEKSENREKLHHFVFKTPKNDRLTLN